MIIVNHLNKSLHVHTDHYEALAKLIELNRRAGKLDSCEPFLQQVFTTQVLLKCAVVQNMIDSFFTQNLGRKGVC